MRCVSVGHKQLLSALRRHEEGERGNRKMDARSAIADTMMLAMSTAISAVPRRSSRRLSDFSDIAHLTVSQHGIRLNDKQKKLIKTAYERWRKKSSGGMSAGEWVWLYVAQKDGGAIGEELKKRRDSVARRHSEAITNILEMAVESADALDDALGPLLLSYAAPDGVLGPDRDAFGPDYWTRISEALCQLGRQLPAKAGVRWETVAAWRIVVLFITNKIEQAFQLAVSSSPSDQGSVGVPTTNTAAVTIGRPLTTKPDCRRVAPSVSVTSRILQHVRTFK